MKQRVFKPLAALVTVAALMCGAAPSRANDIPYTLKEVLNIAREHNGGLNALRQEKGIGEAYRIRAGLYPNPFLEFEAASGTVTGSPSEHRVSLGISQEFITGGKRDKRVAIADTEIIRLQSSIKNAERLLLLEIKTGFYDLLLAESRQGLARMSHELNGQLLQVTKERLSAGEIAELDVNLAKVEAARSEARKIEADHEIASSRLQLLTLMGASSQKNLLIAGSLAAPRFTANLDDLKEMAARNRPDLQAAEAESGKGAAEIALARAERLPNLTAGIALSKESTLTSVGSLEERSSDYMIGLKLSFPIPYFDRNQAGMIEAQAKKDSAGTRQLFIQRSIELEVEAAHSRLAAAEKAVRIYAGEVIPQVTENLRIVQEAYRLGEVGILAVIDEQKKFMDVNERHLTALHTFNISLAKLESAVGVELNKENGRIK